MIIREPWVRLDFYPYPRWNRRRHYIHVEDLADAYIRALACLAQGRRTDHTQPQLPARLLRARGAGHGRTRARPTVGRHRVAQASGRSPLLIADASRIRDVLGGQPQFDDLATIVRHALAWERRLAKHAS